MIQPVSVPVAMVGAVTLYAGLYHLWLHSRRNSSIDLYFGCMCLIMTLYDAMSFSLYNVDSVQAGMVWQRLQFVTLSALGVGFLLFVSRYVQTRMPKIVFFAVWMFPIIGVVSLFETWGLLLNGVPLIKFVSTPFGEITYYESALGPLANLLELMVPLLIAYLVWLSLLREPQKQASDSLRFSSAALRPPRRSLPLMIASGVLLFGLTIDMLVSRNFISFVYVTEYSWFGVMALMSWTLSHEVLDAVTARKALAASEDRIATTLDAIADAVITTDMNSAVLHMNPAAEKMVALDRLSAKSMPLNSLIELTSAETHEIIKDPVEFSMGRPIDPYGPLPKLVTTDGNERNVDIVGAPLRDERGHVVGAVVVLRDLTVQQTAIEQLQHAQKMQAVGQLAGGVAHDLNNLLTPILAYVELAQRKLEEDSPVKLFLSRVQEASIKAAALTKQLLALSRKQVLNVQVIALSPFVDQLSPILDGLLPEEIALRFDLDARAGNVEADPGQLEQILLNLVTNARDSIEEEGLITITTRGLQDGNIQLEVKDNGSGMAPSVAKKIFEPFFTTKPRGKGTGLGLASVRGIVEQHRGKIYVDSEPGQGTSIDIVLPLAEGAAQRLESAPPVQAVIPRGHETILVVEDDAAVRTLIKDALTPLGYQIYSADGLTRAQAIADNETLDLLLSDVVLPGADGPRIYAELNKSQDIPVLFMTGHADARLGVLTGHAVLRKPFTISELSKAVRTALDKKTKSSKS